MDAKEHFCFAMVELCRTERFSLASGRNHSIYVLRPRDVCVDVLMVWQLLLLLRVSRRLSFRSSFFRVNVEALPTTAHTHIALPASFFYAHNNKREEGPHHNIVRTFNSVGLGCL
jgi:hypothetical protein